MQPALEIDRVEWLSSSTEAVVVRVFGRWREGVERPAAYVLIVDDGRDRQAYGPLAVAPADPHAGDLQAWSASFSVPIELRPRLEQGLVLALDGAELALPPAVAGAAPEPASPPPAQIIDRGVLAERRARRAELNEQTLMRRLADAESRVTTLESQLANLEARLEQANAEREGMAEQAREREHALRSAKQREYAEQQLRFESEEHRRKAAEESRRQLQQIRTRLAESESEVRGLSEQQERVRRDLAEAQHSLAADQARLHHAQQDLERRAAEIGQQEQSLADAGRAAADREAAAAAELADVRERLGARRAELEARVAELEDRTASLEADLEAERRRRAEVEGELEAGRSRAGEGPAPDAGLAERAQHDAEVMAELELLREELDQARESAREHAERGHAAGKMLEDLEATLEDLRSHVADVEARAAALEDAERTIDALERTLAGERAEHERRLSELRTELEQAQAPVGVPPERQAAQEVELGALRAELEAARAEAERRSAREAELERLVDALTATTAELRSAFESEVTALQADMDGRVLAEREGYVRELAGMEQRVDQLRRELGETAAALHSDLQAEHDARLRAEQELAVERAGRQELATALAGERALRARDTAPPPPPVTAEPVVEPDARLQDDVRALELELVDLRRRAQAAGLGVAAAPAPVAPRPPAPAPPPPTSAPGAITAEEMAEALSQAVARLRARVPDGSSADGPPAHGEAPAEAPAADTSGRLTVETPAPASASAAPPADTRPVTPRPASSIPTAPAPWLARAIRTLAEQADAELARDLLVELLPVQGHRIDRSLVYVLEVGGAGRYRVALQPGRPAELSPAGDQAGDAAFTLSASPGALAELAGGGMGRRPPSLRLQGRRRRLRPLLRTMREPVTLAELAQAGISVWPGLLLGALAREVAPAWTTGHRFVLAIVIQGEPGATLYVTARSGAALEVGRALPPEPPRATVYADEAELLRLLAGLPPGAGASPRVAGDAEVLDAVLMWVDRVQGRAGA
jgi:hypothetical protein